MWADEVGAGVPATPKVPAAGKPEASQAVQSVSQVGRILEQRNASGKSFHNVPDGIKMADFGFCKFSKGKFEADALQKRRSNQGREASLELCFHRPWRRSKAQAAPIQ